MKTIILLSLLAFGGQYTNQSSSVYICVSPTAKKYHFSKNCRGIQKCTHEIKEVTKSDAINKGYTVCLIEK